MVGTLGMWALRLFVAYTAFVLSRSAVKSGETPLWRVCAITVGVCLFVGFLASGSPPEDDGTPDEPIFGTNSQEPVEDWRRDYPFETVAWLLIASAIGIGAGLYERRPLKIVDEG